jgi:hypothetical protein
MRNVKLLCFGVLFGLLATSCYTEVILEDVFVEDTPLNTSQVLQSYDLWYVDINATEGNGEVPFMQRAFTISFDRGRLFANNNIVGIGKTGNGQGIAVGFYDVGRGLVEIDHDLDGLWIFEVFTVNNTTLELYNSASDTSYFVNGYQRGNFDYDRVFYENITYLLQEYDAWEKISVSTTGALNDFDEENYLQFLEGSQGPFFRSSIDPLGTSINSIVWDYEGNYEVYDVQNDETLKTLTLDYDYLGNDYFELYVINDRTIELYHPDSGTVYEFEGRGYIQFLKAAPTTTGKKRVKSNNPTMNVVRKRK